MANGEFLNLCSDCIELTDTSAMEYCGLTMSLAPHCDKCGKSGGKFGYYKPSEVEVTEDFKMSVKYTDPKMVNSLVTDLTPALPLAARFDTGANILPTRYRIRYGNRWHRVYATAYSNASSVFIRKAGGDLYLDNATEYALQNGNVPINELGL